MGETKLPIDQAINTFILQPIRKVRKKSSWLPNERENYKHNKIEAFKHLNLYWNRKWKFVRERDVI